MQDVSTYLEIPGLLSLSLSVAFFNPGLDAISTSSQLDLSFNSLFELFVLFHSLLYNQRYALSRLKNGRKSSSHPMWTPNIVNVVNATMPISPGTKSYTPPL